MEPNLTDVIAASRDALARRIRRQTAGSDAGSDRSMRRGGITPPLDHTVHSFHCPQNPLSANPKPREFALRVSAFIAS
jgi:hypothetical protein